MHVTCWGGWDAVAAPLEARRETAKGCAVGRCRVCRPYRKTVVAIDELLVLLRAPMQEACHQRFRLGCRLPCYNHIARPINAPSASPHTTSRG